MYKFDAKDATEKCIKWIQDFFKDNGPTCNAVLGISGGKDSSIVAALLVAALGKERARYLEEHEDVVTYKVPMTILNEMCCYQSMINELPSLVKGDVIVKKYNVMREKRTNLVCTSISWKVGTPTLFPPHLNYVQVEEEENLIALVPIEIFYKYDENSKLL